MTQSLWVQNPQRAQSYLGGSEAKCLWSLTCNYWSLTDVSSSLILDWLGKFHKWGSGPVSIRKFSVSTQVNILRLIPLLKVKKSPNDSCCRWYVSPQTKKYCHIFARDAIKVFPVAFRRVIQPGGQTLIKDYLTIVFWAKLMGHKLFAIKQFTRLIYLDRCIDFFVMWIFPDRKTLLKLLVKSLAIWERTCISFLFINLTL